MANYRTYKVWLKVPKDEVCTIHADDVHLEFTEIGGDHGETSPVAYDFHTEAGITVAWIPFDNVLYMESQ